MYVITAHQRYRQTDGRTSSDPMTATLLKHVAVKMAESERRIEPILCVDRDKNSSVAFKFQNVM